MHSPSLFLTALLSLMSLLQATLCHPAGPAPSSSLASESTTTLTESVQAPPTAVIPMGAPSRSLVTPPGPAAANDSVPQISSHFWQHYGWVGLFPNSSCTGSPIGPTRPKINDQSCHPLSAPVSLSTSLNATQNTTLSPSTNQNTTLYMGISWGSGLLGFDRLAYFRDQGCGERAGDVEKGEHDGSQEGDGEGADVCVVFPAGTVAVKSADKR